MQKSLTISRLAKAAEVNLETVRYYQRIGLIDEPVKPERGYRIYSSKMITRIRFIKRAQQLGFKLQEVAQLLQMGDGQCEDVCSRAEQKRRQIDQQISDLKKLSNTLDILINTCHSNQTNMQCPIIETLTEKYN